MRLRVTLPICVVLFAVWEILGRGSYRIGILLSFPSRLVAYAQLHGTSLLRDLAYTGLVALVGFLLAIGAGAVLGIVAFRFPFSRRSIVNSLQMFQVIPVLVFAPFVTMVFGVGIFAHVAIAFLVGIFPFTSVFLDALIRIPEPYLELVRLHRVPFLVAMRHAFLPLSASAAFAGGRVTVAVCVVGATVAEFTGSRSGLGKNVFEAAIRLEPEMLMLSTFGIVAVGVAGVATLRFFERLYVKWKP